MPKPGELTYYEQIGEEGRKYAVNKPFSEKQCGTVLMQVGAVFTLLPPPPDRILECGCGAGWLSGMLQKRGYATVGTDVSDQAIELAKAHQMFANLGAPTFLVADSESLPFREEFDAVVFFDSLHHSVNEQAAIDGAYRALKPGGICVASETTAGHASSARDIAERYDVTEKDMPPSRILALARKSGFRRSVVYPRADGIGNAMFSSSPGLMRLLKQNLYVLAWNVYFKASRGTVVLHK